MAKKKNHASKSHKAKGFHPPGAPQLHKEYVTLTDVAAINTSSVTGANVAMEIGPNGFKTKDQSIGTSRVPQPQIFDRFAQLYQFYQVMSVTAQFIPYIWETTVSTAFATVNDLKHYPVYSCIDPDDRAPLGGSALASYGNMKVTTPKCQHVRTLPYSALGIEKQDKLILETGGSAANRTQYAQSARIIVFTESPVGLPNSAIGDLVFTVRYCFSGLKSPNVDLVKENMLAQAACLGGKPAPPQIKAETKVIIDEKAEVISQQPQTQVPSYEEYLATVRKQ